MAQGIRDRAAPEAVTTYMEEQARRAFEAGRATYMRNWPYAYGLGNAEGLACEGAIRGSRPYPAFEGGDRAGILGGGNTVISAYSRKPRRGAEVHRRHHRRGDAEAGLDGLHRPARAQGDLRQPGGPRAPDVRRRAAPGRRAGQAAAGSPSYPLITQAIYKNVNVALAGNVEPAEAIKRADQETERPLKTF